MGSVFDDEEWRTLVKTRFTSLIGIVSISLITVLNQLVRSCMDKSLILVED